MFAGFNVDISEGNTFGDNFYNVGKRIFESHKVTVKQNIDSYFGAENYLDGTSIQKDWFPEIEADIFLSHSHKDEELAISFAGWLHETFGLMSFVDSCIWGYSNDLLRIIDNAYCYNDNSNTYNYSKRNYSTSHVHMMLCMALTKLIDKTECLFFINTPKSLIVSENIKTQSTASPWVYAELQISEVIRQQPRQRPIIHFDSHPITENVKNMNVKYDVNLKHLVPLSVHDLKRWENMNVYALRTHALDVLYQHKNISL